MNESFFSSSDEEAIRSIHAKFPDELDRLKRAYSVRDQNAALFATAPPSPSQILYGADYDEVNRTIVGLLALRWLRNGQYDKFVETQPEAVRLAPASFASIRNVVDGVLTSGLDLEAVVVSMVINDLGKDPQLAADYRAAMGQDISGLNHDMILLKAVDAGLVPCLDRLRPEHRAHIISGIRLGAKFNLGQLAQTESPPACLSVLLSMKGHGRVLEFRYLEQLLDIAGAAGHLDWTCAKKLIEPIYQAYSHSQHAVVAALSEKADLRVAYDLVLAGRGRLLADLGFRGLDMACPEDRALARILCMGGVADLDTAKLYDASWSSLDVPVRDSLVLSLNLDGSPDQPAVLPTYMPALLSRGLASTSSGPGGKRVEVMHGLLRYLARVLSVTDKSARPGAVIERSVLGVLNLFPAGEEFEARALDLLEVPASVVCCFD